MLNVAIPRDLDLHSAGRIIGQFPQDALPPAVNFDFSALNFIKPEGVAYLGNFCEWLCWAKSVRVTFSNHNVSHQAIRFLDDCGFFYRYLGAHLSPYARVRDTTFPLSSVRHAQAHQTIENGIVPWLSNRMGHSVEELSGLKGVLGELFNNVQDHTAFDIGCIFAQHFPNVNRLQVAFSDFGCGIPNNVKRELPHLSDADCIIQSVVDGFTTGSETNRGIGLYVTLQQVVGLNGGRVTIRSGDSSVAFSRNATNLGHNNTNSSQFVPYIVNNSGFCIGTMIELSLPTNQTHWFGGDEGEEGFTW